MTNENDENSSTQRVTRSKAGSLNVPSDGTLAGKKPLQSKKGAAPVTTGGIARKRAALGDVSNVRNAEDRPAEGKKPLGLAAKAQPVGVQKPARTNSTRSALGVKDKNTASNDLKRPASVTSNTSRNKQPKKRENSSASSRLSTKKEESDDDENVAPVNENVKTRITETIKTETRTDDGVEVKKEIKREHETFEPETHVMSDSVADQIQQMDEEDAADPLMVSEYVYEILDYMKELEIKTMPNPDYMSHQNQLEWRMRGVLIDWLLEVHLRFHLLPETFYLTVNIIDRFLTHKVVQLERLQLVGVTAMFIASKYEEVLSPHIGNFVHVADDGFSEAEILSAERYILGALKYDLSYANPMHFMRRISKADNYDITTRTFAKYLLEITLLDNRFLEFPPSMSAAAAMHLARVIINEKNEWVCLSTCRTLSSPANHRV